MIRSMTGFGEAEHRTGDTLLRVQIKTVNHRFLNTSVRTPPGFDRLEHEIPRWLRDHISRGHVTVTITLERSEESSAGLATFDPARARHYADQLRALGDEVGLKGEIELSSLLRFGDIFTTGDDPEHPAIETERVREGMEAAARAVVVHRLSEGARLRTDMEDRLGAMTVLLDRVAERAPARLVAERDRLQARIAELVADTEVDEERLAREVAWLAEKWDINEELVRFRAHIHLFAETCDVEEPVGKRLSFLVQEMHREANTIGSKANDTMIAHAAVALKEEIERLREQVENVE